MTKGTDFSALPFHYYRKYGHWAKDTNFFDPTNLKPLNTMKYCKTEKRYDVQYLCFRHLSPHIASQQQKAN